MIPSSSREERVLNRSVVWAICCINKTCPGRPRHQQVQQSSLGGINKQAAQDDDWIGVMPVYSLRFAAKKKHVKHVLEQEIPRYVSFRGIRGK